MQAASTGYLLHYIPTTIDYIILLLVKREFPIASGHTSLHYIYLHAVYFAGAANRNLTSGPRIGAGSSNVQETFKLIKTILVNKNTPISFTVASRRR